MNVAIFCPNWVGDAVMATPAIRALWSHFPGARLIGVMRPNLGDLFAGSPWFADRVFLSHGAAHSWRRAAQALRLHDVDLAVLFPNSLRTACVAWLANCRRRVGYSRYGRGLLLTDRLRPFAASVPCPIILAYNHLAEYLGCPDPTCRMELFTTASDEVAADQVWERAHLGRSRFVVCLNPGAAYGSAKCWPAIHFATLARHLAESRGCSVLVLCGPSEKELAHGIVNAAAHPAVHTLADWTPSLGLTKACVRRCHLLITTDSGPRHFAAAFNRPVVTLFGPTHIAWTETYQPSAIHLQRSVPCGPCQRRVCPLDHRCMTELRPEFVLAAATRLLTSLRPAEAA